MEDKKFEFVFGEKTTNAEVVIREGQAPELLAPKAPIKTAIKGVIGVPYEYIRQRKDTGQFTQDRAHLIVDRENISLELIINEDDAYTRGSVYGKMAYHPKFVEFGINSGKVWTPTELGLFVKMNRAFFSDKKANMELVTTLMNFHATVNNVIERSVKESGDRTDNFAQVVSSNLPASFTLQIPIFKGMAAEVLEVETFAQINGREVAFTLLSPGANQTLEELRDEAIDSQLNQIITIAPDIAIIEI